MSGGSFDYKCYRISDFAEDLARKIEENDDQGVDSYGDRIGSGFAPETISRLKRAQQVIELAGKLARDVEWLYSGDYGEESFNRRADEILDGWPAVQMRDITRMLNALEGYRRRCDLLQREQQRMREPERTLVCDALANGHLLPDPDGSRYGHPTL